jgi:Dolichyl-phosphate-mannose-protein mannosyltransferase
MTLTEAVDVSTGRLEPAGASSGPPKRRRAAHRRPRTLAATPTAVSWAVAVVGLALRLREYLANPSLWNDEAELALNIVNRSYAGLTHPLASNQGAPIGFLFLEKTAAELFGPQGFALRLAPFLAALILVIVFRSLAMRTLGGWAGCVAVLLVAVSPSLVYYSTDAKQYSGDAMAVVVLAWMTIRAVERHLSTGNLLVWAAAAAVLVWFSFPAAFAAGSGAVVLLITARRDLPALLRTAAATALWVASFGLEYLVSLRDLRTNDKLLAFWSSALAPANGSKTAWLYDVIVGVLHDPLGLVVLPVAAVLLCVGGVVLVLRRPPIGVFCVVLVAVTLLGGLARQYPVADRMVLFLVPVAALMLAGTLLLSARFGLLTVPLVALVAATTLSSASVALARPYTMSSGREALQYAIGHAGPRDLVLIEGAASNLYDFYHQAAGMTVDGNVYLVPHAPGTSPCSPTQETAWLAPYDRVWIVYADPGTFEPPSALHQYLVALAAAGTTRVVQSYPGNSDVLVIDPRGARSGATSLPVPSWDSGQHGCLSFYLYGPARPTPSPTKSVTPS